ncbi:hypothetical protein AB833_16125 [Chromatiales bacterium (ex Bugula neritina AB1)]|nr:hypothetical protein AB833_16125 [Chromatiales bacterium (ex Bugula neritina AB1)]
MSKEICFLAVKGNRGISDCAHKLAAVAADEFNYSIASGVTLMSRVLLAAVVAAAFTQGCTTIADRDTPAEPEKFTYVGANDSSPVMNGAGDCLRSLGWSSDKLVVECSASSKPVAAVTPPAPTLARLTFDGRALFQFDSAALTTLGKLELNGLVSKLKRHGGIGSIAVVGHADSIGTADYNQSLSERRAATVREYLESTLSNVQVKASGMGERVPVADNATDTGRQENRRVEVKIDAVVAK